MELSKERQENAPIEIEKIKSYLKTYDGEPITIMEVCGSHTASIAKNGIRSMLSPSIRLVSGPGCPVCVTPTAYIDKLISLACDDGYTVATFGDLIRVPGSEKSLAQVKGEGADIVMVYTPFDVLPLAKAQPQKQFVFAAVGFETTAPVYALFIEQLLAERISNVKLLTALKTMPPVIEWLCENDAPVDAFLAPGHVCVVTGSGVFSEAAKRYKKPFGVSGFLAEEILQALYGIVKMREHAVYEVRNFYPSVVSETGNGKAQEMVNRYFTPCDATWRGIGEITDSGRCLRNEYFAYDAGSSGLTEDHKKNTACRCDQVLLGKISPQDCPLFRKVCSPLNPQGACMVSSEGACFSALQQ